MLTYGLLFESITLLDEVSPNTKLINSSHLKCSQYRPGGLNTSISRRKLTQVYNESFHCVANRLLLAMTSNSQRHRKCVFPSQKDKREISGRSKHYRLGVSLLRGLNSKHPGREGAYTTFSVGTQGGSSWSKQPAQSC